METIQVVIDSTLLQATQRATRRLKQNRSALIRDAIREHLKRLEIRELEERDHKGFQMAPPPSDELSRWESQAQWPA